MSVFKPTFEVVCTSVYVNPVLNPYSAIRRIYPHTLTNPLHPLKLVSPCFWFLNLAEAINHNRISLNLCLGINQHNDITPKLWTCAKVHRNSAGIWQIKGYA